MNARYLHFLYDEEKISRQLHLQKTHQWDLESSIPWTSKVDTNQYLVALDRHAFLFPGSSQEERLVISQMMGLIIAASIYEMEESLIRLKQAAWVNIKKRFPVGPEFEALGEQFFIEELKHSECFKRYVGIFAESLGIERQELEAILPTVERSRAEALLGLQLKMGGQSFWWIVAIVEQVFLDIYNGLRPFKSSIEPLYYTLHEKHFEEEARHASFPYLLIELCSDQKKFPLQMLWNKIDLGIGQLLQGIWAVNSLAKLRKIKKLKDKHPFFDVLARIYPDLEKKPLYTTLWKLFVRTPYVGPLINPTGQDKILKFARHKGAITLPFPHCDVDELVGY